MICMWSSCCHCQPVISCFIKIQIGLTFLVPAYPGCPGKEAVKRVSVCQLSLNVLCIFSLQLQSYSCDKFPSKIGLRMFEMYCKTKRVVFSRIVCLSICVKVCMCVCVCVLVEDIKLNSTVFHWPDSLSTVFEVNQNRLENRRERAKDELKKKIVAFEEKLAEHNKEIETFRKKEVRTGYRVHCLCLCRSVSKNVRRITSQDLDVLKAKCVLMTGVRYSVSSLHVVSMCCWSAILLCITCN